MTTYDPPVWTDAGPTPPAGGITYAATTAPPPPPPPAEVLVPVAEAPAPDDGGRPADPRWARPALLVLLLVTAGLYLWDLGASGWANSFYSAAVQAGTQSWKALFFGSLRRVELHHRRQVAARRCGRWRSRRGSSASTPGRSSCRRRSWASRGRRAVRGGEAVARRRPPACIAGAVLALTPVAALMFRFNNPDAMLVLLLTLAAYALAARARDRRPARGSSPSASFVGLASWPRSCRPSWSCPASPSCTWSPRPAGSRRRLGRHGHRRRRRCSWPAAGGSRSSSCGRRRRGPYIGGSQNNSFLDLLFGYNGFGRLTGNETGSVGGGGGSGGGQWGATGLTRLFNSSFGGQISWLLPAALILLVALLVLDDPGRAPTARGPRRCLGRLARRHRARHQPRQGHHPRVLHGRPGPRDRCARRHRRGRAVAPPAPPVRRRRPGPRLVRHRAVVDRAARPQRRLDAVAAPDRAGRRPRRHPRRRPDLGPAEEAGRSPR